MTSKKKGGTRGERLLGLLWLGVAVLALALALAGSHLPVPVADAVEVSAAHDDDAPAITVNTTTNNMVFTLKGDGDVVVSNSAEAASFFAMAESIADLTAEKAALVSTTAALQANMSSLQSMLAATADVLSTNTADFRSNVSAIEASAHKAVGSLETLLGAAINETASLELRLSQQESIELTHLDDLYGEMSTLSMATETSVAAQVNGIDMTVEGLQMTLTTAIEDAATSLETRIGSAVDGVAKAGVLPFADDVEDCDTANEGQLRYNDGAVELCTSTNSWSEVGERPKTGLARDVAATSCLHALQENERAGLVASNGKYWMKSPSSSAVFEVYCDMTTNGGGWTLVAYAGRINGNKANTAGTSAFWPLFGKWGTYDPDSPSSKNAFSLMKDDKFAHIFQSSSYLMARRTSARNTQLIWPVASVSDWNRNALPIIDHMYTTRDGENYDRRTNINIFEQYGQTQPAYVGYDINMCGTNRDCPSSNCDGCGVYESAISHRAMLYWEILESGYTADQWFHADPMRLTSSRGPDNSVQDIEFYLREEVIS